MSKSVTEDVDMTTERMEDSHKDQIRYDRQTQQLEPVEKKEVHPMPSSHLQVELLKNKYGGLLPKKPPLISKDHEHAFFDSADWALGKQGGQKAKGPLEALRPKLEPTPHHNARSWRSTFAPAHNDQDIASVDDATVVVGVASEGHVSSGDDDGKNAVASSECTGRLSMKEDLRYNV